VPELVAVEVRHPECGRIFRIKPNDGLERGLHFHHQVEAIGFHVSETAVDPKVPH
jgi:hypothetical protein